MPFLAQCPYCHRKVRVADNAAGWSVECRRCGSSFTAVSMDGLPEPDPIEETPAEDLVPVAAAPETIVPAAAVALAETPPPPTPAAEPVPSSFRPQTPLPLAPLTLNPPAGPLARRYGFTTLGAAALCCACLGLLSGSLASTAWFPIGLSGSGFLLGLLGVLTSLGAPPSRVAWSGLAILINLPLLLLALFWPSVLSRRLPEIWSVAAPETGKTLHVTFGAGASTAPTEVAEGEWIDATREGVQMDDLRVRIRNVQMRQREVKGTDGKMRLTREKFVSIAVRVQNVGVTRKVEFDGWAVPATPESPAVTLRDHQGKTYRFRPQTGSPPTRTVLTPTKSAEETLVFDAPTTPFDHLRLELPAAAFGGAGVLRFQIPRSMIALR